jgi:sec-independent protein translocase protein TatA
MGLGSTWHWLLILAVVVLLFGAGRISGVMGDLAKGIKSFKKGLADDDADGDTKAIEQSASRTTAATEPVRSEKS